MIHVFPTNRRCLLMRYAMWMPVLLQVLILHYQNGLKYATYWANCSLLPT